MKGMTMETMTSRPWRAYLKKRWQAFRAWQERPYEVAPMCHEAHDCPTCQTHYVGNYCPRCGQSAKIGRFSVKKTLMLFIDVWGMGNRGMFRSLRDLLFRPGYMIRDYLGGMRMAYFPPFNMLFVLTTFSILVTHGLNINLENFAENEIIIETGDAVTEAEKEIQVIVDDMCRKLIKLAETYPNITTLISMLALSVFLYPVFRNRREGWRLSFPEFFVAMVFAGNMTSIVDILLAFFCVKGTISVCTILLFVIPLKQLSGFSWTKTIKWFIAIVLLLCLLFILIPVTFVSIMLINKG